MPKSWDIDEYKDIESINFWKKSKDLYGNDPKKLAEQRTILDKKARDHARTPMQWNGGTNAGFCESGVQPWMRVNGKASLGFILLFKTAFGPVRHVAGADRRFQHLLSSPDMSRSFHIESQTAPLNRSCAR